jgi:thiamine biosynthesis lipoprotein
MKRFFLLLAALIFSTILVGCEMRRERLISGRTMGTTYHIKIITGFSERLGDLDQKIENRLETINSAFSIYRRDSEISQFNAFHQAGTDFEVSVDFFRLMQIGQQLHQLSNGAWDATLYPLVDLWGFGPSQRPVKIPPEGAIHSALKDVGFDLIKIVGQKSLIKLRPSIKVDLSSVAKGYGVDQIAELIRGQGFGDFLVEIGGEVYASGLRQDGQRWKVGINTPRKDAAANDVYRVVSLQNKALATSGDYRSFIELEGRQFSHVIDPRSGFPVINGIVSVTVLADTCALADGLATAIMVMGPADGLGLLNRLPRVEGLIIAERTDGRFDNYVSAGFSIAE